MSLVIYEIDTGYVCMISFFSVAEFHKNRINPNVDCIEIDLPDDINPDNIDNYKIVDGNLIALTEDEIIGRNLPKNVANKIIKMKDDNNELILENASLWYEIMNMEGNSNKSDADLWYEIMTGGTA